MAVTGAPVARILLAEDNPADVYLIQRALQEHGVEFELDLADSGKQALSFLREYDRSARDRLPTIIVLDLNLPQHDGIEILQHIRRAELFMGVPVVVLTSSDSPKDQMRSMESGADRYIRKPSNLDDFMVIGAALKELISLTPIFHKETRI